MDASCITIVVSLIVNELVKYPRSSLIWISVYTGDLFLRTKELFTRELKRTLVNQLGLMCRGQKNQMFGMR